MLFTKKMYSDVKSSTRLKFKDQELRDVESKLYLTLLVIGKDVKCTPYPLRRSNSVVLILWGRSSDATRAFFLSKRNGWLRRQANRKTRNCSSTESCGKYECVHIHLEQNCLTMTRHYRQR